MNSLNREAPILIAGGGIGGLTAAACLLQAGIPCKVFEQASELGEIGAGIQISANAGRVLHHLGLKSALNETAAQPDTYRFRLFHTGEVLQEIPLGKAYETRHGVPYYTFHRADFHKVLEDKVRDLDANAINLNAMVTGFENAGDLVNLNLANGETHAGRGLIAADGIRSVIRPQIVGETELIYTGDIAWRVTVRASDLPQEHRLTSVNIWVGPDRHAVAYPVRRGELINFVGSVEMPEWRETSWSVARPWEELQADFEGWNNTVLAIIDAADRDQCFKWSLNNREPVSNWQKGLAVLMGDAAHPTLPYMAQGAAMAIEDAAVLSRALAEDFNVESAFDLYQRNRIERTTRIVRESSANRQLFHLPDIDTLVAAFSKRDMNAERSAWLFSYDPLTVALV